MSDKQYIWYCVRRKGCGVIIFKTKKPFLADDGTVRCPRCNELMTFDQLMKANPQNLRNLLKKSDETFTKV